MMPNDARHPMTLPSHVPAGVPNDSAMGVPTMAMANARPCKWVGTNRRA